MTNGVRWLGAVVLLLAGVGPARAEPLGGAPLADDPTLIALAVALALADAPDMAAAAPAEPRQAAPGPEIELVATIRAKALRFDAVPATSVVVRGAKRRTTWKAERVNLPARPEPGVVYRDVQVRLTVTTDVEELAALVAEAQRAARGIRIDDAVDAPAAHPTMVASAAAPPVEASPTATAAPAPTPIPTASADATPVSSIIPVPAEPAEPPAPAATTPAPAATPDTPTAPAP